MRKPRWVFHATNVGSLPSIRKSGLRPDLIRSTAHEPWSGRKLVFFGTSLTTVIPYAGDFVEGALLRFPRPARFELNPDQPANDAEGVTEEIIAPHLIEIWVAPGLETLYHAYREAGGYERSRPVPLIEKIARGPYWQSLL